MTALPALSVPVPTVLLPSFATSLPVGVRVPSLMLWTVEVTLARVPLVILTGALASVVDPFRSRRTLDSFAGASVVQGTLNGSGPVAVAGVKVNAFGRVMS